MKALFALVFIFASTPTFADQIDDLSINEINAARGECLQHEIYTGNGPMSTRARGWAPGWEHCETVEAIWKEKVARAPTGSAPQLVSGASKALVDKLKAPK